VGATGVEWIGVVMMMVLEVEGSNVDVELM
jgi:hypothetical protein